MTKRKIHPEVQKFVEELKEKMRAEFAKPSSVTPREWNDIVKKRLAEYEDSSDELLERYDIESSYDPETKRISTSVVERGRTIVIRQVK